MGYWLCRRPGRQTLHKYKVIKLTRSVGTLVNVYEAVQPELNRKVELRLLNMMLEEGGGELARFEREFKAIARLDHPNIIKVYDWGQADKRLYYITELKSARSLQAHLDDGRLFAADEVLGIGVELAGALAYLHEKSILHRGLALDSVLCDDEMKRPVISEFTVVKDAHRSDLTARGIGHLTPLMTTPETICNLEADARTDVFLLAALLYKLLAKQDAGIHSPGEQAAAAKALEAAGTLPQEAAAVLMKALSFKPEDRYSTAAEFGAALKDARERLRLADKRAATRRNRPAGDTGSGPAMLATGSTRRAPPPAVAEPALASPPPAGTPEPAPSAEGGRFADLPVLWLALGIGLPLAVVLALAWLAR
ncbi:MAG: protein kinase [Candidatus Wallbacteria bacterium]|nr:protein kinase [Candidatus Wallbacteria bacterium]